MLTPWSTLPDLPQLPASCNGSFSGSLPHVCGISAVEDLTPRHRDQDSWKPGELCPVWPLLGGVLVCHHVYLYPLPLPVMG